MTASVPTDLLDRWRADTPGTSDRIHLNNAGAALMPRPVIEAMTGHIEREVRLGGYEAEDAVAGEVAGVYEAVASLIGARVRNVALVENATVAVSQALSAFDFRPGDVIVTTADDYTSNQLMYLALAERAGVEVLRADDLPAGGVDPSSVRQLVAERHPRLVALTWIPTNGGLIQRAEEVGAICAMPGCRTSSTPARPSASCRSMSSALGADFVGATARKFLRGPRGIGFLYVSDRMLDEGRYPLSLDMRGGALVSPDRFELVDDARRFENWEFSYALVLGLGAAARYALDVGVDIGGARARSLASLVRERLRAIPSARLIEPGERLSAIVTCAFDGRDPEDLVLALRERGINTSSSTSGPGPVQRPRGARHINASDLPALLQHRGRGPHGARHDRSPRHLIEARGDRRLPARVSCGARPPAPVLRRPATRPLPRPPAAAPVAPPAATACRPPRTAPRPRPTAAPADFHARCKRRAPLRPQCRVALPMDTPTHAVLQQVWKPGHEIRFQRLAFDRTRR